MIEGILSDWFFTLKNDESLTVCSGAGDIYRQCRFFLPWPWHLLFLDGLALVLFYVLFMPFKIQRE